ncbi:MAG: NADPH-dependent F420 reductase [Chloroflexota bacterium]
MAPQSVGFLGGTGPEGRGLAVRFAAAGRPVVIGSRDPERGQEAADKVRARLDGMGNTGEVTGGHNEDAAGVDIVFVTVPYAGQAQVLGDVAGQLAGKLCVNVVSPLEFRDGQAVATPPSAGSAAEEAAELVPGARWAAGMHTLPAQNLWRVSEPMETDALLCADDEGALAELAELAQEIPGLRAVNTGALQNARYLEAATALLININRLHKAHASLRVAGI